MGKKKNSLRSVHSKYSRGDSENKSPSTQMSGSYGRNCNAGGDEETA